MEEAREGWERGRKDGAEAGDEVRRVEMACVMAFDMYGDGGARNHGYPYYNLQVSHQNFIQST